MKHSRFVRGILLALSTMALFTVSQARGMHARREAATRVFDLKSHHDSVRYLLRRHRSPVFNHNVVE